MIGPFPPSKTMQNDGKKSENAGEGKSERNLLKIRAKKWSQRSESNRGPVHYEVMRHIAFTFWLLADYTNKNSILVDHY